MYEVGDKWWFEQLRIGAEPEGRYVKIEIVGRSYAHFEDFRVELDSRIAQNSTGGIGKLWRSKQEALDVLEVRRQWDQLRAALHGAVPPGVTLDDIRDAREKLRLI